MDNLELLRILGLVSGIAAVARIAYKAWPGRPAVEIPDETVVEQEKIKARRELQRHADDASQDERLKKRQDKCSHLKGGRMAGRWSTDYNVSNFTYIDGTQEIKCLTCGKKWFNGDLGWQDALNMFRQSTNTPNSSERPMYTVYETKNSEGKYFRTTDEIKAAYPDWNGHVQGAYDSHFNHLPRNPGASRSIASQIASGIVSELVVRRMETVNTLKEKLSEAEAKLARSVQTYTMDSEQTYKPDSETSPYLPAERTINGGPEKPPVDEVLEAVITPNGTRVTRRTPNGRFAKKESII